MLLIQHIIICCINNITVTKCYYSLLNAGALQARRCFSVLISSRLPLKINLHGISNPSCGRSEVYLLPPITTQSTVPFFNKNNDKIHDNCLGRWPTTTSSFRTAITYVSLVFNSSLSQVKCSSTAACDRYGTDEYNCLACKSPF